VSYITELFIAWYSGVEYEQYVFNRATDHIGGRMVNDDL
jgi:hypothetical protein